MFPIFKKIRFSLMNDHKTSKYLKYAFGEIVLVVIGILIALQINNWNENRKNEALKKSYYRQILNDLEKDEAIMLKGNTLIDSFFVRLNSYEASFERNEVSLWAAATEIGKVFSAETIQGSNFEAHTNTISSLINSGDIKLIPLETRNILLDFKYKQSGLIDYLQSQSLIISRASLETQKLYGGVSLPGRINNHPEMIKYFSDENIALQSLLELEAILYEQTLLLKNAKERSTDLIGNIQSLKKVLNEELNK